jgi:hypothetical protein
VDDVYMSAVQLMTGATEGWPMTVVLTADGPPVLRGHLFPGRATASPGRAHRISHDPEASSPSSGNASTKKIHVASRLGRAGNFRSVSLAPRRLAPQGPVPGPSADRRGRADASSRQFDSDVRGGFGRGPEVPATRRRSSCCLRHHRRTGDEAIRSYVVRKTLAQHGRREASTIMLGGGFHRYATDPQLAGAPLREDAVRQRPADLDAPRDLPGVRRRDVRRRGTRHPRVGPPRDDEPRRRLLLRDGRR